MGFRGAATWDLEAQQQVGWDLKGQQRDLEAQQHGTGLSRGYFFLISVQQILNFSQSGEELYGASQAVQTDGHLFH